MNSDTCRLGDHLASTGRLLAVMSFRVLRSCVSHRFDAYSITCIKRTLPKRPKIGFQDQLLLNAGQKYCRMLRAFCNTLDLH